MSPKSLVEIKVFAGDTRTWQKLQHHFIGEDGLNLLVEKCFKPTYGKGLSLILLKLYIEGEFTDFDVRNIQIGRFYKKSQSIAVKIPVKKYQVEMYTDAQMRLHLFELIHTGLYLVQNKIRSYSALDINFDQLMFDVALLKSH